MSSLPVPSQDALQLSEQLKQKIQLAITAGNDSISFSQFMQMALYEPGLGYYSAGSTKFGSKGDFVTAPETSALFGRCFAHQIDHIFRDLDQNKNDQTKKNQKTILEFGAGSGRFACDILEELESLNSLPDAYLILEVSADLRDRQKELIKKEIPHLEHKFIWLERLPTEKITGVILANEVLDAMPFDRFQIKNNQIKEQRIAFEKGGFFYVIENPSNSLRTNIEEMQLDLPDDYVSEINQTFSAWFQSLNDILQSGVIFCVDYGCSQRDYYHPDRINGTLICHYRHRAHDDPFVYIGLQDISASVDFTSVAEAGFNSGFEVAGYTTQAHFLINNNLINLLPKDDIETTAYLKQAQEIKKLTLPSDMGERFKVIAFTKEFNEPLKGFEMNDLLERL